MAKRFDVVIGNPPYQEESTGDATNQMPIYHLFMDAAYAIGEKAVLITPARFLFNAGYTPKAWNAKMLKDPHLSVAHYVPNSAKLFPGTDIKGGVVVTLRDSGQVGEPIGRFSKHPEMDEIVTKVESAGEPSLVSLGISNDRVYRYTEQMHEDHPELASLMSGGNKFKLDSKAFDRLSSVYFASKPDDGHDYIQVLGLGDRKRREFRWIRKEYVAGPAALSSYKIALGKANGSGAFGEVLAAPMVLEPTVAVTGTFITIGAFKTRGEAQACATYVKSKFARALLGVLKVTQDNLARVWTHIPAQDFTSSSDIDWSRSIAEIDQQLYEKYGLDDDEVAFIESHVKPME